MMESCAKPFGTWRFHSDYKVCFKCGGSRVSVRTTFFLSLVLSNCCTPSKVLLSLALLTLPFLARLIVFAQTVLKEMWQRNIQLLFVIKSWLINVEEILKTQ